MNFNRFTTEQILTTLEIESRTVESVNECKDAIINELDVGNKWLNQKSSDSVHITVLGILYAIEYTISYLIEVTNSNRKIICDIKNLVNLKDKGRVIIDNPEYIADDLKIYYGKRDKCLEKQYEEYKKFTMKCDLLGVKYSTVEKDGDEYILTELVSDESGVATIPDFVTQIDTRDDSFLMNRFTKLIWKNPLVYSISGLFTANGNIVNIDLSECNLSAIPTLSNVFFNCHNLKSVDFGDNDFHNVVSMQSMFEECINLKRVEIPNAKFNRHCNLKGFLSNCRDNLVLDMSKAEVYAEKPIGIDFYPRNDFALNWYTGGKTRNTLIKYKATSLAHIISSLPMPSDTINRLVVYKLDELTGINYIKCLTSRSAATGLDADEIEKKTTKLESGCKDTDDYKKAINADSIIIFVGENYGESYSRCALLKSLYELDANEVKEIQALDNAQWAKNYKYSLIICNSMNIIHKSMHEKSICAIYFNKYSEWDMEDTEEWKILN